MADGLISVIVPVYNAEAFIDACVGSIQAQIYDRLEIILVNDGSPDGSGDKCDALAKSDNRILVVHKQNGGVSSALNAGLDVASGEFITFVGSDDTIDPDMYERLYNRLKDANADICGCGTKMIYDTYTRLTGVPPHNRKIDSDEAWNMFLSNPRAYMESFGGVTNKLTKRSLLNRNGTELRFPEDMNNFEDGFFMSDCVNASKNGIVFVDFAPYNYFQYNNTQSLSKRSDLFENMVKWLNHLEQIMLQAIPQNSDKIKKVIACQKCISKTFAIHTAIINKVKSPHKLNWSTVKTILRDSDNKMEKFSSVLMFFLPSPIYRAAYSLYCKVGMQP